MTPNRLTKGSILFIHVWSLLAAATLLTSIQADDSDTPVPPTAEKTPSESPDELKTKLETAIHECFRQHDYRQAKELLKQLLSLQETTFPTSQYPNGHKQIVRCLRGLASADRELKNHDDELRWSQQSLEMSRKLYPISEFPNGHIKLADAINEIGLALFAAGDLTSAEASFSRAVLMLDNVTASQQTTDSWTLSTILGNQAAALERLGDYQSSSKCHERRIQIFQRIYEHDEHPAVAIELASSISQHARTLRALGKYSDSRAQILRSLAICRQRFPDGKNLRAAKEIITAIAQLGLVDLSLGDTSAAKQHQEQALVYQRQLGKAFKPYPLNEATILDGLLMVSVAQCRFSEAKKLGQEIESIIQRLYPDTKFPQGHENAASFLLNIGLAFHKAGDLEETERRYKRALEIWRRAFEKKNGLAEHPRIVEALYYLGNLYQDRGEYDRAYTYYDNALRMARRLYPKEKFPNGNGLLSAVLQNMANHCWKMGETETAAACYREVIQINESLYSQADGKTANHPILQQTYVDWADFLTHERKFEDAESFYRRALGIAESLHSSDKYPHGHPDLADCWTRLGNLMLAKGNFPEANKLFARSLRCHETILANEDATSVRPIALTLSCLGKCNHAAGDYALAETYYRRSLEMCRRLYPHSVFKSGHPIVAERLRQLGQLLADMGKFNQACNVLIESARMEFDLLATSYDGGSDAQLLNIAAGKLESIDQLLSTWQESEIPATDIYSLVWERRGLTQRLIANRQRLFKQDLSRELRPTYEEYVSVRRDLSSALLFSSDKDSRTTDHNLAVLRGLNSRKEELERALGGKLSPTRISSLNKLDCHEELSRVLPERSVFVDFIQYAKQQQDAKRPGRAGHRETAHLAAFLIAPDLPVRFVRLGPADDIDELVASWRDDLLANRGGTAAGKLRRRIWDPISKLLPDATETVYLRPDGRLALVAWGALPDPQSRGVLLERHAFALVSSGQALLEGLRKQPEASSRHGGVLLAVGNVDYGSSQSISNSEDGLKRIHWPRLPGSLQEVETVVSMADNSEIILLTEEDASLSNVVDNIPKARWAHFATHGFWLDAKLKDRLGLLSATAADSPLQFNQARTTILARNPFLQSGLALAGINEELPTDQFGLRSDKSGLLTAEMVVTLDCQGMDLAVLSACKTGLGDIAIGDGVFAMRDAFHIAGARNVIASLWSVDDKATTELMNSFYRFLWKQKLPPLTALRKAQLDQIRCSKERSKERGILLSKTVPLANTPSTTPAQNCDAKHWAGFLLSGPGY